MTGIAMCFRPAVFNLWCLAILVLSTGCSSELNSESTSTARQFGDPAGLEVDELKGPGIESGTSPDTPTFPLAVVVTVGDEQLPIGGLTAVVGSGPNYATYVQRARTNEHGTAEFALPEGRYRVSFESDRELPYANVIRHHAHRDGAATSLSVNLPRSTQLVFRAIDIDTGEGVPGVQFDRSSYGGEIWEHLLTPDNLGHDPDVSETACQTGGDGYFQCLANPQIDYYSYSVRVVPDGYTLVENVYVNPIDSRAEPQPQYEMTFRFHKSVDEQTGELRVRDNGER